MSTHNIPFSIFKKKITLNCTKSAAMGLNTEFETAVVNEPSMFEPLKFNCTSLIAMGGNVGERGKYFTKGCCFGFIFSGCNIIMRRNQSHDTSRIHVPSLL